MAAGHFRRLYGGTLRRVDPHRRAAAQSDGALPAVLGPRHLCLGALRRCLPAAHPPVAAGAPLSRGLHPLCGRSVSLSALQSAGFAHGAHTHGRDLGRGIERISLGHGAQQCFLADGGDLCTDARAATRGELRMVAPRGERLAQTLRSQKRLTGDPRATIRPLRAVARPPSRGDCGGRGALGDRRPPLVGGKASPVAVCDQLPEPRCRAGARSSLLRPALPLAPGAAPGAHVAKRDRNAQSGHGHGTCGQRGTGDDRLSGGDRRELQQTPRRALRLPQTDHATTEPLAPTRGVGRV